MTYSCAVTVLVLAGVRLPMRNLVVLALILAAALFPAPKPTHAQQAAPAQEAPLTVEGREAEEIWIATDQGRFRFTAEIADEPAERSQGLMFRETMPAKHGMLFDFGQIRPVQMWMRNTPISLDMVFLDKTGTVTHLAERTTPFSDAIIDSGGPISHVLELNAGISRLIGLKPGDRVEHASFKR